MSISEKLTQQKLLEILVTTYIKGQEKEDIQMIDLLEDMKQQVLSVLNANSLQVGRKL